MSFEHINYTVADRIAVIGLNRPPVNAISLDFINEIIAALGQAGTDGAVRCVVIK